ncbi:MAG: hypothetical protein V7740_15570, partial [Pseudomonas marincola]
MPNSTLNLLKTYLNTIFTTTEGLTSQDYMQNLMERIEKIQFEQPQLSDCRLLLQSELTTAFTVEYLEISNASGLRQMFMGKADEIAQKIWKLMPAPSEAGPEPKPSAPVADTYADENKDDGPDGNDGNGPIDDAASTAKAGALAFKAAKTRLKAGILKSLTTSEEELLSEGHKDQDANAKFASSNYEFIYMVPALSKHLKATTYPPLSYDGILEAVVTYINQYISDPGGLDKITKASYGGHLMSKIAQFIDAHSALLRNPAKCISDFEKCSLILILEVNSSLNGKIGNGVRSQLHALKYLQDAVNFVTGPGPNAENDLDWERIGGALKDASQKNDVTDQLAQHV